MILRRANRDPNKLGFHAEQRQILWCVVLATQTRRNSDEKIVLIGVALALITLGLTVPKGQSDRMDKEKGMMGKEGSMMDEKKGMMEKAKGMK